jgi:hypothetical protein
MIHLNHAYESAARRAAVTSSQSEALHQGHGDTPRTAQHTRSLGFDARIAAASRHQSTAVQQIMRQMAKRTRAVCGDKVLDHSFCALPSPQALVSTQRGHISKGNSSRSCSSLALYTTLADMIRCP